MKKTSFILSLLLGLFVTTFALTACGSDDDNGGGGNSNPIVGTWTIKGFTGEADDLDFTSITFKSNGDVDYPGKESGYYMKWTASGNTLRIDMGEGKADDAIIGTYTINGNTATYSYHWMDSDGKWEDDTVYTMILEKK